VFKTVELGAWYRIRWEGKSVFAKVLERQRNSYTFRYADEKGKVRTGKVSRSDIRGRLGDHLIPDLESAIIPTKRRKTTEPKAKARNAINPGDWHRFQYEGRTVPGVVYRIEGNEYRMFFLCGGVPAFVTLPRKKIGPREEGLTAVFREEMAKNPEYLEEWVSTADRLGKSTKDPPAPEPTTKMPRPRKAPTGRKKAKPSKGQRLLFPE
jgi:hypothetical protein